MTTEPRVAIMQPYLFPYIGYFHLIHASALFVFYDDVQFIKGGWINRNRILSQGGDLLFTVPLASASISRPINDTAPAADPRWKNKFYKRLKQSYAKAPFFAKVVDPVMGVFSKEYGSISDMAIESIVSVFAYLHAPFAYTRSSICSPETKGLEKSDRLIEITRSLGHRHYVNPTGTGKNLYSKPYFLERGVVLSFVESKSIEYSQFVNPFVPWLSIIDVLMFNGEKRTLELLSEYRLQ